jgi:dihydrofolate reductase
MAPDKRRRTLQVKASVFIATSLDGFIARPDGGLDWLPADGVEPHGYDEFIATVDAIVMGRKTFETVLWFGPCRATSDSSTWPRGRF